jgi:hypothetical protein
MSVTLTCDVCGDEFEREKFTDAKDALMSHVQAHQRAGEVRPA